MDASELQEIVLRTSSDLSEMRRQLDYLISKEKRVHAALETLKHRVVGWLNSFHRDKYKSTDLRLVTHALSSELLIFDKLGYVLGIAGARFLLGVDALLDGRNQAAVDHFNEFTRNSDSSDKNFANAHYLAAMICFNRRDFSSAIQQFDTAFKCSPDSARDWQSKTYVGELMNFQRRPKNELEKVFHEVEDGLRSEDHPRQSLLRSNLYLKWANCYVATVDLHPKEPNPLINSQLAISLYKLAKSALPKYTEPESLLPVVIDYSLAQALLIAKSIDMDLVMTPAELLADVFRRLRRIVLTKREDVILAQCYLMLGTCAAYSPHISNDMGEIYLEYARMQTLAVASDVCFYSCITKELLNRDEYVSQIEHYARLLDQ